jgi:hypothetical protein
MIDPMSEPCELGEAYQKATFPRSPTMFRAMKMIRSRWIHDLVSVLVFMPQPLSINDLRVI